MLRQRSLQIARPTGLTLELLNLPSKVVLWRLLCRYATNAFSFLHAILGCMSGLSYCRAAVGPVLSKVKPVHMSTSAAMTKLEQGSCGYEASSTSSASWLYFQCKVIRNYPRALGRQVSLA